MVMTSGSWAGSMTPALVVTSCSPLAGRSRRLRSGLPRGESQDERPGTLLAWTLPRREGPDWDHGFWLDHRRVLPDHPPEHQDTAPLPRSWPAGARARRPPDRLPLLHPRPGADRAGDPPLP